MTRTLSSQGLELLERLHDPTRASYEEIARAERAVHTLVRVEITQHQFEALVSFALEIGHANFAHSSLLKELNRGHHELIPDELLRWTQTRDPASGQRVVDKVLERRRGAEVAYWLSGTLPAAVETSPVAAAAPPKHPKPAKETMEVKANKDDKDGKDSKDSSDGKGSKDGKDGSDDKGGKDGKDDSDGGKSGKDGSDGKSGKDGSDGGKSGKDNKDGKEGKDGSEGKEGKDGKDGKEGKDQKDGTDKGKERSDYAPEHPVIPMYLGAKVSDWSRFSV